MRETGTNAGLGMEVMNLEDGIHSKVQLRPSFPGLPQEATALVALAHSLYNMLVTGSGGDGASTGPKARNH